jgi:hypothetical protein
MSMLLPDDDDDDERDRTLLRVGRTLVCSSFITRSRCAWLPLCTYVALLTRWWS